jgi:hypothetical protein
MEFLMTYGWAIMIVLVGIGAFAYFGILNPQKTLPDRCTFTAGIDCAETRLILQGGNQLNVTVVLANKLGERIIIQNVTMNTTRGGANYGNTFCLPTTTVDADGRQTISCLLPAGSAIQRGKGGKAQVTIQYRKLSGSLTQVANGELMATIQ